MVQTLNKCTIMFVWGSGYHSTARQQPKYVNLEPLSSQCRDMIRQARDFDGEKCLQRVKEGEHV